MVNIVEIELFFNSLLNLTIPGGMFLLYRVLKAQSDHRSRHEGKGSTKLIFNR